MSPLLPAVADKDMYESLPSGGLTGGGNFASTGHRLFPSPSMGEELMPPTSMRMSTAL
jgi:hypothetical protein